MPRRSHIQVFSGIALVTGAWLLLLGTYFVYHPGLSGPFLLDDHVSLVLLAEDERSLGAWIERLRQAPEHVRQRGLSHLSFMVNQALAGAWTTHPPFPFKLGNLLVHLLCAAAVFALARRLVLLAGATPRRAAWVGLLSAAMFALHPLQVSTTLYVVQRMAQLAALGSLLAVLAYIHWRINLNRVGDVRNVFNLALVPLFAVLAFFSKENGALVPLYLLTVELCFFRFPPGVFRPTPSPLARTGREVDIKARFEMGFALLVAGPLLAALVALPWVWPRIVAGYALRDFTLLERALTQVHALGHYLGLILWPRIGAMGLYRDDFPITRALDLPTLLLGGFLLGSLVAAVVFRRRAPIVAFAVLWFFASHAMESSLIALELVFEHRNYLALFGPALALAYGLVQINRPRWLTPALATAGVLVLAGLSHTRAQAWSSYEVWLRHEVTHRPTSLRAGTDWVLFLAHRGRFDEVAHALADMHVQHPNNGHPLLLAIGVLCWDAQASAPSSAEIERLGTLPLGKDSYHLFNRLLERKEEGRCAVLDWQSMGQIARLAASHPQVAGHPTSAAAWRRHEAHAFMQTSDWPRAQASLQTVLALRDDDLRDWLALARVCLMQGDVEGYRQARAGVLNLLSHPQGAIAEELAQLDAMLLQVRRRSTRP